MSPADARRRAVEELRRLRYGPESKDYFWINDMHPYLIMHPYRPDLEGKDISGFSDPNGKKLFVEFVKTVKNGGAGYVDYQWQWKDDPQRIVPKISYVKGFDPWGWIIGTGIYVEDVRAEIAAITRRLTAVCLAILLLIIGLSSYVIWQSAGSQRRQRLADEALRESEEKYRLLAETAREFILAFEPGGRITYVNRAWREASGFDTAEMLAMTIFGIMPLDEKPTFQDRLDLLYSGGTAPDLFETGLTIKSGERIPVEATLAPLMDAGNPVRVFITARDVTGKKRAESQARLHREQLFQADKMATLGTLVSSGDPHRAENLFRQSLEIDLASGRTEKAAESYRDLAKIMGIRDDLDEAENLLLGLVEIEAGRCDKRSLAEALGQLAAVRLRRGVPAQAEKVLDQAEQIYRELNDACGMAETQGHLGIVYSVQDRADQAEAALISALQINTALNRKAHQADNYGNLANLYWSQGLLSEAGSCYDKALSLFREIGNRAKTCKVQELRDSLKNIQP